MRKSSEAYLSKSNLPERAMSKITEFKPIKEKYIKKTNKNENDRQNNDSNGNNKSDSNSKNICNNN